MSQLRTAVVTTQAGTEEFAEHGRTAEIVFEARTVAHIAAGLQRVVTDVVYRRALAAAGPPMARRFTWEGRR